MSKFFRAQAKDGELLLATTMNAHGLKSLKAIRRKAHVRRALAAASKGEKTE